VQSLKPQAQAFLARIGLYQRLKGSRLYDLYWQIADRRIIDERASEIAFYRTVLKGFLKNDLIFDVGANHGSKTDIFLRLGAKVVSVEPDEANQTILRERFLRHRLNAKPVTIVGKAVSDRNTVETLWIDAPGSAKNTLSHKWVETLKEDDGRFGYKLDFARHVEVETVTLERLMSTYGAPFFIKIDVEGFEVNVLRGLQRPVPFISFEVNLPHFKPEGFECIEQLQRVSGTGWFNYTVDARHGLSLPSWRTAGEFLEVLDRCTDKSIEVFWTATAPTSAR
jgi:FkbM family methyltransferase